MQMIPTIARISFAFGVLLVTWLSLIPGEDLPGIGPWDKLLHAAAYAALALTGGLGFRGRRSAATVAVGLLALGSLLEVIQAAIPGREASVADASANAVGIAFGLAAAGAGHLLLRRYQPGSG